MQKQEVQYRAYKYIRLSDAYGNNGESNSVQNQRKFIDEYLENHPEIEVVGEKIDDGWSGLLFDRPAFNEMMIDIENGTVNCCITKDLSRLGREYFEMGRLLRRIFPIYGVRFIAINDNIDTLKDSGDDLTISLKSIINDAYSRDISIKTRSALNSKRKGGDYVGACPVYGYIKSEEDHNQLVIDAFTADIVREIFRMKINGMSTTRIADTLNERGVLSPLQYKKFRGLPHPKNGFSDRKGAKWSETTIARILTDETYTGTLVQGRRSTPNYKLKVLIAKPTVEWIRTEKAHKVIIHRQRFDLVQYILRLETRTSPDSDSVHILSGILICDSCGNGMSRYTVPSGGKKYVYYRCKTGKKNGCKLPSMPKENELIACILHSIKAHIANIASIEQLLESMDTVSIARELATALTSQFTENTYRLDQVRKFKAGLYENMISGNLSKDEYRTYKAKYTKEIDELAAANIRLRQDIDDALSCKHERLAWIEHFRNFENLDTLDRKTVLHFIKSIRVFSKNEIEIDFNFEDEYETILEILMKNEMPL